MTAEESALKIVEKWAESMFRGRSVTDPPAPEVALATMVAALSDAIRSAEREARAAAFDWARDRMLVLVDEWMLTFGDVPTPEQNARRQCARILERLARSLKETDK